MADRVLTDRQRREQEFYEEYSARNTPAEVNFDPVVGDERRPWNSYWRFIDLVQSHFTSEGQRLLDFGCGTGFYSLIFARVGYEVFGFDIAPNNIAIANRLSEKYDLRRKTHFAVGTAETLDYEDEFFDVVTGINILHHVDIKSSVTECMRVLKPGGIAMFHEPVRAPVFDAVRESPLGTKIVSKEASFDRHITPDERKLNGEDLKLLEGLGREFTCERFLLFSRLDRFIKRNPKTPSLLEKLDSGVFKWLPFTRTFGGECVIVLRK